MKMILLKSLKLHNFLSHEDTTIDFSPTEKTLIDGMSGAGKSSIIEAIVWCLYGEARTMPKSLIRKGAKSARVSLELTTQEFGLVNIDRAFQGATQKLQIYLHDGKKYVPSPITGIRPSQEWIEKKLIGASYKLFVNSVAYLQEGGQLFVSLPANERRDLLLEIVKAEDYDTYYEQAKTKIHQLEVRKAEAESAIGVITTTIASAGPDVSSAKIKESIKDLRKEVSAAEKDVVKCKEIEDKYQDALKAVTAIDLELREDQTKLASLIAAEEKAKTAAASLEGVKKRRTELAAIIENLKKTIDIEIEKEAGIKKEYDDQVAAYAHHQEKKPNYALIESVKEGINADKDELTHLSEGKTCPSGDACPFMGDRASQTTKVIQRIAERSLQLVDLTKGLEEWETADKVIKKPDITSVYEAGKRISEAKQSLQEATTEDAASAVLVSEVEGAGIDPMQKFMLEASVADLTGRKADATDALEAFNGRLMLSALTDTLYVKKTNLAIDESRLADVEKREAEIAKAKKDLEERKKDVVSIDQDLAKLAVVKDAFGPKGIKTVVIDFLMPRLEEEVNNVLSRLSEFTVRFDTQAPKTDGGVKEGLFITIVNDIGEELPFESFSGGEKLKITVAISEALASLQKAKFRLFDEMFIGLDETSTESFAMVLERLQEDFPQVLCISHLRQIKDMFTRSIVVTKHNGISSIRV